MSSRTKQIIASVACWLASVSVLSWVSSSPRVVIGTAAVFAAFGALASLIGAVEADDE